MFGLDPTAPLQSLDDVDPELLRTYEKLGIPLNEQKFLSGVAVDAIFDSVSVGTTMKKELGELISTILPTFSVRFYMRLN